MADELDDGFAKILETLATTKEDVENGRYAEVMRYLDEIHESLIQLQENVKSMRLRDHEIKEDWDFTIPQDALLLESAVQLGQGGFGKVFRTHLKGNPVAVKVIKTIQDKDSKRIPLTEGKLLRHLSHDNIVAFRGMGQLDKDVASSDLKKGSHFIVMEYISNNLKKYVEKQTTHENKGLPLYLVWDFARQIANGLEYLHTMGDPFKPIAHRDLKPDNILLDTSPMSMRVKLADFGLAYQDIFEGQESQFNVRWAAPEIWRKIMDLADEESDGISSSSSSDDEESPSDTNEEEEVDIDSKMFLKVHDSSKTSSTLSKNSRSGYYPASYEADIGFYLQADIYSYGMVIAFCLTGESPWGNVVTTILESGEEWNPDVAKVALPQHLPIEDYVRKIIEICYSEDTDTRPKAAQDVVDMFFKGKQNPYKSEPSKAEFFFCGFLTNTNIFVADSLVDETSEGYFRSREIPKGYPKNCLICEVQVKDRPYHILPKLIEEWEYYEKYKERMRYFNEQAAKKVIENNATIALKSLATPREGELEQQEILLKFAEGTYVHHRAMRDIWRQLSDSEREQLVPSKSQVNQAYSTSFGLHVAVITADDPPKFLFCRRANRVGMASPKEYTCGAVESVSKKDCFEDEVSGGTCVSLLNTASRGLEEELRVELVGNEVDAICLTTVYMKYDTHEWGMCGFVDLSDKRIAPERRLKYKQLQSRFTGGPKDKFEHDLVEAVDFTLDSMMDFVRSNFMDFASSGKLVVVKVMQSFFGMQRVENAFRSVDPSDRG